MWVPNTPHLDLTSDTTQRGVWPQRGCALGLSLQSAGRLVRNREPCESSVAVRKSSMEHHSSGQPGCSARLPKREPFPSSPVLCFQNIGFWRVFFFFSASGAKISDPQTQCFSVFLRTLLALQKEQGKASGFFASF